MIWKGPIVDNNGKEVLAKDKVADDKFLGGINFYVKGVEGKVPGGEEVMLRASAASGPLAQPAALLCRVRAASP